MGSSIRQGKVGYNFLVKSGLPGREHCFLRHLGLSLRPGRMHSQRRLLASDMIQKRVGAAPEGMASPAASSQGRACALKNTPV